MGLWMRKENKYDPAHLSDGEMGGGTLCSSKSYIAPCLHLSIAKLLLAPLPILYPSKLILR